MMTERLHVCERYFFRRLISKHVFWMTFVITEMTLQHNIRIRFVARQQQVALFVDGHEYRMRNAHACTDRRCNSIQMLHARACVRHTRSVADPTHRGA